MNLRPGVTPCQDLATTSCIQRCAGVFANRWRLWLLFKVYRALDAPLDLDFHLGDVL
jgi:hypothetical protein